MQRENPKPPFIVTNRRKKDGMEAMHIVTTQDDTVLYRVRFKDKGRNNDAYMSASLGHWNRAFA